LEAYVLTKGSTVFSSGIMSIDMTYDNENNYVDLGSDDLNVFDAIQYYGLDDDKYKYIAKSNSQLRTLKRGIKSAIKYDDNIYEHIVIVYNGDNSINIYYNGELYSNYTKGNLTTFDANQYRFLFCKTHGPVLNLDNDDLMPFNGTLIKSAIYDYALSSNEVLNLYQNRNVSDGEHACNMLIPELTTLDTCDDIYISFNIRINKIFPTNQEIFVIGSSYTAAMNLKQGPISIFFRNDSPVIMLINVAKKRGYKTYEYNSLPDNFGILGKEYNVTVRIANKKIYVAVTDVSNGILFEFPENNLSKVMLIASNVTIYVNEVSYFDITNASIESCVPLSGAEEKYLTNSSSLSPTNYPTFNPTNALASDFPTLTPTLFPTSNPAQSPTGIPTMFPTLFPTINPARTPTDIPTGFPTDIPSISPTVFPPILRTKNPTSFPTTSPTNVPTVIGIYPSELPSINPTLLPSKIPQQFPSYFPSTSPSNKNPTTMPTPKPSINPSNTSSTKLPTQTPTIEPTLSINTGNLSNITTTSSDDINPISTPKTSHLLLLIIIITVASLICCTLTILIVYTCMLINQVPIKNKEPTKKNENINDEIIPINPNNNIIQNIEHKNSEIKDDFDVVTKCHVIKLSRTKSSDSSEIYSPVNISIDDCKYNYTDTNDISGEWDGHKNVETIDIDSNASLIE